MRVTFLFACSLLVACLTAAVNAQKHILFVVVDDVSIGLWAHDVLCVFAGYLGGCSFAVV